MLDFLSFTYRTSQSLMMPALMMISGYPTCYGVLVSHQLYPQHHGLEV